MTSKRLAAVTLCSFVLSALAGIAVASEAPEMTPAALVQPAPATETPAPVSLLDEACIDQCQEYFFSCLDDCDADPYPGCYTDCKIARSACVRNC